MMKAPLISTVAGMAALAAGLAGAQTYSYPTIGYGTPYGYASNQMRVVRCESVDSRRTFCGVDTRGGVQVYRQLSRQDCIRGRNWQASSNGITVTNGCRAEFVLGSGYGSSYSSYNGTSSGYYTTDRYGRRIYVPASGMSNGGYTTDRYGRRIYDDRYGTYNGTYNGGYTTDRYGRRIYTQSYPYPQETYDPGQETYYRNRDAGPYGTVPTYGTTPTYGTPTYGTTPYPTTGYEEVIQCRSSVSGRTYCGDRTRTYNVRYSSNAYCVEGRTYGRDSYGTWVSGGCNLVLEPGGYEE
jgi:hypothetical protein